MKIRGDKLKIIYLVSLLIGALVIQFGFTCQVWCSDVYVNPDMPDDSNDGSSWETAKKTIYSAYLAANNGDKIHLKNVVHVPLSQNIYITKELFWVNENEDDNFQQCIIEPSEYSIRIYNAQNVFKGITFRDGIGDYNLIIGHGGFGNFIFCNFSNNESINSGGAILLSGDDDNYARGVFEHCEFNSNTTDKYGGAIAGTKCRVSCNNCTFINNNALQGGGAAAVGIYYSSPCEGSFSSCSFINNTGGGTGALSLYTGQYLVDQCTFEDNTALDEDSVGGAIFCEDKGSDTNIDISKSDFIGNKSKGDGGAVRISNSYSDYPEKELTFTVTDCLFSHNIGKNGGGLHCGRESQGTVKNCIFSYNEAYVKNAGGLYNSGTVKEGGWMIVEYCLFYYNKAQNYGGGMYIAEYPWTIIQNCTFYENEAGIDGDQIAGKNHIGLSEKAILKNSICWGNGEHHQILGSGNGAFESVSFCCFPEGKLSDINSVTTDNIYVYPNFINPAGENFRLGLGSSCIDKGIDIGITNDLDGSPVPMGYGTDIGSYESYNQIGRPFYIPAQDAGYFIWQDADDGRWHIRWSGDSSHTYFFKGTILSTGGFTDVNEYNYESNDELQVDNNTIIFSAYAGAGEDGADFFAPAGVQVTFDIYVDDIAEPGMVHVGYSGACPNIIPFSLLSTGIADICEGDFDTDGDVDGLDLTIFAADFGRTGCSDTSLCNGNFDGDGDADGKDLAVFASGFGRTNCPAP